MLVYFGDDRGALIEFTNNLLIGVDTPMHNMHADKGRRKWTILVYCRELSARLMDGNKNERFCWFSISG